MIKMAETTIHYTADLLEPAAFQWLREGCLIDRLRQPAD